MFSETRYGELRGFLEAMAWVNNKADHQYTFTFESIHSTDDPKSTIENALRVMIKGAQNFCLEQIDDWRKTIHSEMLKWFFEFQDPKHIHLQDPRKYFSLSDADYRQMFLDRPIQCLEQLVSNCSAWRFHFYCDRFYECASDDFLFHSPNSSFWLHFGVSD